jgi:acyl carrier protein
MTENATTEVRQLLASICGKDVVDSIEDDDSFFDGQVIDSLHLVSIIDGFQSQFGIEIAGEDLSPENFGSIAAMARLLTSKRGTAEPSR